jgi:plastocyanin
LFFASGGLVKTLLVSVGALVLAATLVACGGKDSTPSASPTTAPTRAPEATATQPPPSPSPTTAPTKAPTEVPTEAPTAAPPSQGTGGGAGGGGTGGGGGGGSVSSTAIVVAQGLAFVNKTVSARAGTVTLVLQNKDLLVAHDIRVDGFAGAASCTGVCETSTTLTAGPGSYRFVCTIHPDMIGTLTLVP